jgi:hypothetical protein
VIPFDRQEFVAPGPVFYQRIRRREPEEVLLLAQFPAHGVHRMHAGFAE